jgi:hypothetical protein
VSPVCAQCVDRVEVDDLVPGGLRVPMPSTPSPRSPRPSACTAPPSTTTSTRSADITIDPETARLVAAAVQAVLRASTPRYARPGRHHRLHQASQRISPNSRTPIPVHLLGLVPGSSSATMIPITLLRGCEIPSVILGVQPKLGEPRKRSLPNQLLPGHKARGYFHRRWRVGFLRQLICHPLIPFSRAKPNNANPVVLVRILICEILQVVTP